MAPETRRRIQLALLVAFALAGARIGYVFYQRSHDAASVAAKQQAPPLEADYYVTPKKLHDYDVQSLRRDLAGHSVWVREGYRFTFYPFDAKTRRADLAHDAGTLGPIERIEVKDVVLDPQRQ